MKAETRYGGYLAMAGPVIIRPPLEEDASAIQALVHCSPPLDQNSCYAYLLQAWHFSDTCALAEIAGRPVAYVSAYIPPRQPDTLFIWQIVVSHDFRGLGLGKNLVEDILGRSFCENVNFISATVSLGNAESEAFFRRLAQDMGCPLGVSLRIPSSVFLPDVHAGERLFRIGPFDTHQKGKFLESCHEAECI